VLFAQKAYMYLTYYVHWFGIEEEIDCKNARRGKLQRIKTTLKA